MVCNKLPFSYLWFVCMYVVSYLCIAMQDGATLGSDSEGV